MALHGMAWSLLPPSMAPSPPSCPLVHTRGAGSGHPDSGRGVPGSHQETGSLEPQAAAPFWGPCKGKLRHTRTSASLRPHAKGRALSCPLHPWPRAPHSRRESMGWAVLQAQHCKRSRGSSSVNVLYIYTWGGAEQAGTLLQGCSVLSTRSSGDEHEPSHTAQLCVLCSAPGTAGLGGRCAN